MARHELLPFVVLVLFFAAFAAPLLVLVLVPVGALPVRLDPALLWSAGTRSVLLTTLAIAGAASLMATPVLLVFGWLVARTDLPGRTVFDAIGIIGLTLPDLLRAVGWILLLNPVNGILNLPFLHLFHAPLVNLDSRFGLAFAYAWGTLPLDYLVVRAAIRNLDPSLEEASRVAGHSPLGTFVHVTLPSLLQTLLIIFVLGFLIAFTDFDTAAVIAPLGHYEVLATDIYLQFLSTPPGYSAAATLGLLFLAASLALFGVYLALTRRASRLQSVRGGVRAVVHHLSGARRWAAVGFCSAVVLLSFGLPLLGVVWLSLTVPGRPFDLAGVANYVGIFRIPFVGAAWVTSVVLAVVVATVCIPIAVVLAYAIFKSRVAGSRLLEYLVILPRGTPSVVYGLGVFLMVIVTPGLRALYGTIAPLFFAVIFISVPVSVLIVGTSMVQIGDELEEAARVGGSGWVGTFVRVILPLNLRAVLNAVQYAFLSTFSNVGSVVILLLAAPSTYLLMPLLLDELGTDAGALNVVAAAAVLITGFLGLLVVSFRVLES